MRAWLQRDKDPKFQQRTVDRRKIPFAFACVAVLVFSCLWLNGEHKRDLTGVVVGTSGKSGVEKSALESLVMEGYELHVSLRARSLDMVRDLPTRTVPPYNPYLASDEEFIEDIARGGSQGRLGGAGMRSALYARYATGNDEVGCYGLEAKSAEDAEQREKAIREIWAYNASLERARVHRKNLVLIVVWHDGVSPECWDSVNMSLEERLHVLDKK